jgi:hypothetical protein
VNRAAWAALAGAAIAAALVMGCGGGEVATSSTTAHEKKRLTKAEYVREATALCLKERQWISTQLEPLLVRFDEGDASPKLARQTVETVVLPGYRVQYEGLRALVPPWEDADFLDLMLLKLSRSIEDGENHLAKFFRIKPSDYSEFAEGSLMTREYGIKGCGSLRRSPEAVLEDF